MKKWNKKIYIFFSLFFLLSFLVYPSFSVLAASTQTTQDSLYVPTPEEANCYIYSDSVSSKYDHANSYQYLSGSKGSMVVGWLGDFVDENGVEKRKVHFAPVSYLSNPDTKETIVSHTAISHYDKDDNLITVTVRTNTGSPCDNYTMPLDKINVETFHMMMFSSYESAVSFALYNDRSGLEFDPVSMTDDNSVYSSDIGYLQNVQIHTRGVKDDDGETDYLTYDTITNTGFDITQEGVRVSLYTKYQGYYFENWTEWIGDDNAHKWVSERKYQKSVDGSSDKFFYEYTQLLEAHADDKAKNESLNQSLLATPFGKIEYWLRIEKKNSDGTWTYGGWVSMADSKASMTEGDKQTKTYDNEENLDPDGGYGTGTDTYQDYGEGNTAEEADEKAFELPDSQKDLDNYDSGYDTMDSFVDGIKSMKNGLGDVPKIISEVFKALPVPVITAIGCGFFLAIVLRILGR